jgi:phospholipase/carboxylesterase
MNDASILIQQAATPAPHLFLLFHGVGSVPESMVPLGRQLAQAFPAAMVVSVASPFASDISAGRQWFSVVGVTEANRGERVAAVMPLFDETVRHWQQQAGADAKATTLVGFSQGSMMALESTRQTPPPAARVVAFAGRYVSLPASAPAARIHLVHGDEDRVMPVALAHAAATQLRRLGAEVTLDTLPAIGHEPHPALVERALARLRAASA